MATRGWRTEDWMAVFLGFLIIVVVLALYNTKAVDLGMARSTFRWTTHEQIAARAPGWIATLNGIVKDAETKGQKNTVALATALKEALAKNDRKAIEEAAAKNEQDIVGIAEVVIAFWAIGYPGRSLVLLVLWVVGLAMKVASGLIHILLVIAIVVAVLIWFMLSRTLKGFEVKVLGSSPRAGRFAGFSARNMVFFSFLLAGACAGLAGIIEVAGASGQLRPIISPGYGFTAIIVAFLGRLNPLGAIVAGLVLALTYLGGEAAQHRRQLVHFAVADRLVAG